MAVWNCLFNWHDTVRCCGEMQARE
jgi:hypothetical protein